MITKVTDINQIPREVLLEFGDKFFHEAKLQGTFNPEHFERTWITVLGQGLGTIWKLEVGGKIVGLLGAFLTPDLCTGDLAATEAFWYVLPEHRGGLIGIRLLEHYEQWSLQHKAVRSTMIRILNRDNMNGDGLDKLYRLRGYEPSEMSYTKIWQ